MVGGVVVGDGEVVSGAFVDVEWVVEWYIRNIPSIAPTTITAITPIIIDILFINNDN
ncbi:hypothetical protein HS5_03700 [Acidianus sp. HS-5]|nr:hypothetical protein HS5_03700 [Acidianus sp. HS-5]